jgi:hypothetical protein
MKPTFPLEEIYKFIAPRDYFISIKSCMHMMQIYSHSPYADNGKKENCKEKLYSLQAWLVIRSALRSTSMMMQSNGYTSSRI